MATFFKNRLSLKKLKKGAGEFVSYTITIVFMTAIIIFFLSGVLLFYNISKIEDASSEICRDIIVCQSLDEAQAKAQEEAEKIFADNERITNPQTKVEFTSGTSKNWLKGNFIKLTVSADVATIDPITSGPRESSMTMMIERNPEDES